MLCIFVCIQEMKLFDPNWEHDIPLFKISNYDNPIKQIPVVRPRVQLNIDIWNLCTS